MSDKQFEIKIGVNSGGVITGINSAVHQINRLSESVHSTLEAIGIKELIKEAIKSSIEWAAQIKKQSRASGIGVEAYEELSAAAKELTIDVDDATTVYKKLQVAQVDAIKGNIDAQRAFRRIGIEIRDLRKLTPAQLFEEVGKAFEKMPPSAQATADAITLMGKKAEVMVGAFRGGFLGAMKDAKELGEVLDEKVVESLVRADDAMSRFALQAKVAIASLIPPLVDVTGQILNATQATILWIQTWWSASGTRATKFNEANKAVDAFFKLQEEEAKKRSKYENPNANKPKDASDVVSNTVATNAKPVSDKLISIGIQRGGGGEIARIPAQQLKAQQEANTHLRRIAHYYDTNPKLLGGVVIDTNDFQSMIQTLKTIAEWE